jgi:dihydropteroate synthase type 2
VNLTEDSFSDGGRYLDPGKALEHARRLTADGADAVDLGAASSHPDAMRVPPALEIERLEPVVAELVAEGVRVSIDSYHPEVQRWALARGVAFLNDIRGFPDASLYAELASASCDLIVMHSVQRGPATRAHTDPEAVIAGIDAFFAERIAALEAAGVAHERLLLDPGMGFFLGSDPEPSRLVLRGLGALRTRFGCAVAVSVSRKSFLRALSGREVNESGAATLAAELFAASQGVDWIRTHDVRALRDALTVQQALS